MMKLQDSFFMIIISLCFIPTTLYATEYTHYFLYNTCGYKNNHSCWLKIITNEDNGGLRCRASASLRAAIIEVVPKDQYVQVIDLAISQRTGKAFFKVSRKGRICYMRATKDRFSYSSDYSHNFFHQQGCYYTPNGCSFEVITDEDNGGLRCRAKASLRSSIIEVVPKGDSVSVIDLAISKKGNTFFKVSRGRNICYMRATQSRFSLIGKKGSTRTTKTTTTYIGDESDKIMTGAGVYLRQAPQRFAKKVIQLQLGTIVFPREKTANTKGEQWYKIATPNGYEGWVLEQYVMSLDNFDNPGRAYLEVANRKINSHHFGDLVELCHFLNRVSFQVTKSESVALLKLLYLVALQRSLEQIPRYQQHEPRYSKWLDHRKIKYNGSTGAWVVKDELFQQWYQESSHLPETLFRQWYQKYGHLPIANQIIQQINSAKTPSSPQNNTQTVSGKKIFITHLGFMDTSAGMPLGSSIAKPITQAVIDGIQLAQQDIPHFKLNESGHQIENSEENVNQFVNLFWDFNLTRANKIEAIIQQMMTPNQVDVIITGQYLEKTGGTIHVRPSMVSKNLRRIITKSLIFQEQELICSKRLCQQAHEKIRNSVKELLENL